MTRAHAEESIGGLLHPRLSPDGRWIAASYQGSIVVRGGSGSEGQRATSGESWDIEPAWAPDGSVIAFLETPNFVAGQVRLLDVLTGEIQSLPRPIRGDGKLWFSSDGKRLFGSFSDGKAAGGGWIDLETGEFTRLPIGPGDPDVYRRKRIKFGVTGKDEIFYAIHRDEAEEQGGNRSPKADLYRCRPDGTGERRLFTWPARVYDIAPVPGEEALVIVSDLGRSHNDLWEIPLRDPLGEARCLSTSFADDDRPSFDASGEKMLWSDNASGTTQLFLESGADSAPVAVPFTRERFDGKTSRLTLRIGSGGESEVARVSVRRTGGKFHFPPGKLYRLTGSVGHFYARGEEALELPPGEYEIAAWRGLEYEPFRKAVELREDATVRVVLEPWTRPEDNDWYSGENHVHANYGYGEWYNRPESIFLQAEGEGLNVCNTVIANSDGDAIFDREFFLGQVDPRSSDRNLVFFGQEFRSTIWGHMTLSRLSRLVEPIMTGFPGTTNPWDVPTNADIALATTEQGGTIGYTHPAGNRLDLYDQPYSAKGLPVDAALGRVALMDIHGHTYDGSVQLWYRLLNCGLWVAGSSGTDVFLNRVRSYPPGWARTYVHLPGGLGYDSWIEGQNAGRSFFTNGPMLQFAVDEELPGGEIIKTGPGKVKVTARVDSRFPLDRVELVRNGHVVETIPVDEGGLSASFEGNVEIPESGWLALRARGPAHPDVIRDPTAHTNPVRIEVLEIPNPEAPRSAAFFLEWIDRLETDLEERDRIPSERAREHVRSQLEGARAFYRGLQ